MSEFGYWHERFLARAKRVDPVLSDAHGLPTEQAAAIAWSLARFQLGEASGGRIAREIWSVRLPGVDDDYRAAVGLFVAEEHRHGRILAQVVSSMGGELVEKTWTEGLFTFSRRLLGTRLKMVVLLAAEVIGIGFYGALTGILPPGEHRDALAGIIEDEAAHLAFHAAFFREQLVSPLHRWVFRGAWSVIAHVACAVVLWDHRRTLRALGIGLMPFARRLHQLIVVADRSVVGARGGDRRFGDQSRGGEQVALASSPHLRPLGDHLEPPRAA